MFAHAGCTDPRCCLALDSRKRVHPSSDTLRRFHRGSISGNVALGYSASALGEAITRAR
jgi:hypothetical protein